MMAYFKLILAILFNSALAQGKDESAMPEDNGVGCRLDAFLKFKRVNNDYYSASSVNLPDTTPSTCQAANQPQTK